MCNKSNRGRELGNANLYLKGETCWDMAMTNYPSTAARLRSGYYPRRTFMGILALSIYSFGKLSHFDPYGMWRFHGMVLCAFTSMMDQFIFQYHLCRTCCFHQAPCSRNDMLYTLSTVLPSQKNAGISWAALPTRRCLTMCANTGSYWVRSVLSAAPSEYA